MLTRWLTHPLTRGLDLDDPRTTHLRRRIIREKALLHRIYQAWYEAIASTVPAGPEAVLELGSGGGFMSEHVPHLIPSERFATDGVGLVLDGTSLPLAGRSLRGIVMTNVFHHLPSPRQFLAEAARCVRPGGVVSMIEPWVSAWSRFVYGRLHHEPFDPRATSWEPDRGGPLSAANGAIPWILFARDRAQFEREFPLWRIDQIRPMMPLAYLLSGGVSLRALAPGLSYGAIDVIERACLRWNGQLAMFAHIVLTRLDGARSDGAARGPASSGAHPLVE